MNAHIRQFTMVEEFALRQRIERVIETLLAVLDQLDPDPDIEGNELEDDGDQEWDEAENGVGDWEGLIEQYGGSWNGMSIG